MKRGARGATDDGKPDFKHRQWVDPARANEFTLARYTADGALDSSLGAGVQPIIAKAGSSKKNPLTARRE